jgi:hypothetical protein
MRPKKGANDTTMESVCTQVATHHYILKRSHLGKEPNILKGPCNTRPRHRVNSCRPIRQTLQRKLACIRGSETGDHIKESSFSSAVRANQSVDLARQDAEAHIIERQ